MDSEVSIQAGSLELMYANSPTSAPCTPKALLHIHCLVMHKHMADKYVAQSCIDYKSLNLCSTTKSILYSWYNRCMYGGSVLNGGSTWSKQHRHACMLTSSGEIELQLQLLS